VSNATHPDNESAFLALRQVLAHFDCSTCDHVVAGLADHFGSIAALLKASAEEIVFRAGVPEEIAEVVASFGRLHHAALGEEMGSRPVIASFDALKQFVMHRLRGSGTEELIVILLDRKSCLIREHPVRSGSIDHVALYPREVARLALLYGASAVILAHNHPSGDPTPSQQDIELTRTVSNALTCLGIALHEHIIVGHNRVAGLRAMGRI
jgi:DNA repair protein RadC